MKKIKEICFVMLFIITNIFYNMSIGLPFNLINCVAFFTETLFVLICLTNIKKMLKNKKCILFSFLLIPCIFIAMQLLLKNSYYYYYFLIYLFLNLSVFIIMYFFDTKYTTSLVSISYTSILLAYILGLFNILSIVKIIFPIIFIIELLFMVTILFKNKNKAFACFTKYNDIILPIFSFIFISCIIGSYNRYVHIYDEFSLWAIDVKYLLFYNHFGTSNYAPIVSLWQYLIEMYNGFNDMALYFGLNLFVYINLISLLNYISKNNKILYFIFAIIILNSFALFGGVYGFTSLYCDLAMSSVFINVFAFLFFDKKANDNFDKGLLMKIYLILCISILTLIKPQGFILSLTFLTAYFLSKILKDKPKKMTSQIFRDNSHYIKKLFIYIFITMVIFLSWRLYRKFIYIPADVGYDFQLSPASLSTNIASKLNCSFLLTFFNNFISFFDSNILGSSLKISWIHFMIVMTIILFLLFRFKNNDNRKAIRMIIPFVASYVLFIFLTVLSIFYSFSIYEASILASFIRYINVGNYAFTVMLLVYLTVSDNLSNKKISIITLIIFTIVGWNIGFNQYTYYVSDYKSRIDTVNFNYSKIDKFDIVNKNVPENSRIYVLDQTDSDGIMALWYSRYYLFPKYTSTSGAINWKIKTPANEDDLSDWGLTYDKFIQHLIDYNFEYLFLYTTDEYLNSYLSSNIISPVGEIKDGDLFKILVNKSNNTLKFLRMNGDELYENYE